jgi:hypothetical protein
MRNIPKKAFKEKEKRNDLKKTQTELELPKIPKISQSLIKALYKYKMGEECGLKIHASYIEGFNFPSSEAQQLGNYFEYTATGQLPRDKQIPLPKVLKNGTFATDYERMNKQVQNFKNVMDNLNFSIEQTGYKFTHKLYDGTLDILAHDNNIKTKDNNKKRIIIDLKSTGLINDKWSEFGWANESIEEKESLMIQAIHYKMLAKYEWGIEDIPFYFFVFSTKNDWEYKLFKVNVDESTMTQHLYNLKSIKTYLDSILVNGFKAKPTFELCKGCAISITCSSYMAFPSIQEITI